MLSSPLMRFAVEYIFVYFALCKLVTQLALGNKSKSIVIAVNKQCFIVKQKSSLFFSYFFLPLFFLNYLNCNLMSEFK